MKILNMIEITFKIIPRRRKDISEKTFIKIMNIADKMSLKHMKECGEYLIALAEFREKESKGIDK